MIPEFKIFNRKTGKHAESLINDLKLAKFSTTQEPYEELEIRVRATNRNEIYPGFDGTTGSSGNLLEET